MGCGRNLGNFGEADFRKLGCCRWNLLGNFGDDSEDWNVHKNMEKKAMKMWMQREMSSIGA